MADHSAEKQKSCILTQDIKRVNKKMLYIQRHLLGVYLEE